MLRYCKLIPRRCDVFITMITMCPKMSRSKTYTEFTLIAILENQLTYQNA